MRPCALPCLATAPASVKAGGAFKRSGWGAAICEQLAPADGDTLIQGKSGLCGFAR